MSLARFGPQRAARPSPRRGGPGGRGAAPGVSPCPVQPLTKTSPGGSKISLRRRLAIFMRAWLFPVAAEAAIALSPKRSARRARFIRRCNHFPEAAVIAPWSFEAHARILFFKISRGDNGNNVKHAQQKRALKIIPSPEGEEEGDASKEPRQPRLF